MQASAGKKRNIEHDVQAISLYSGLYDVAHPQVSHLPFHERCGALFSGPLRNDRRDYQLQAD